MMVAFCVISQSRVLFSKYIPISKQQQKEITCSVPRQILNSNFHQISEHVPIPISTDFNCARECLDIKHQNSHISSEIFLPKLYIVLSTLEPQKHVYIYTSRKYADTHWCSCFLFFFKIELFLDPKHLRLHAFMHVHAVKSIGIFR